MADNLQFPILFDLDKGVDEAIKKWNNGAADKLEKAIQKRALNVKLSLDTTNLDNLDAVKNCLAKLKIEPITPENRDAIKELVRELKALASAMERVSKFKGVELPELQSAKAAKMRKEIEQADEKLRLAQERVRQSNERLILSQKRAEQQAHKTGKAYSSLGGYLTNLARKMVALWSFERVSQFLTNIREVTAEFELQRVSLGAIIQDQQKANQLFAEIKSFALTSPLKILDLTKYTKQVAAYGFEADKLFDTTKMLADISVGLGADMSRATLFLGQVYATNYLRASELRQATELGIPLVDKLAKKLEELNGRAYTAADVMDLISKRAIGFELVEQIFKDMTSEGGEFYNMQVKQSQTLFGMWSKLGDAAAILYDQIGNTSGVNATMKTMIRFLELMMRNWQTTGRIVSTVAISIGTYVLMLKNAAVASKALTIAEAQRLAVEKGELVVAPKLITAIIGKGNALMLSIKLTDLHTAAMARQMAATNVLSKAFWRLTAAMLANPWALVAAAIAAVGAAIWHFTGNAETAAKRAEKLNDSVAALQNLEDTTENQIETYNELIDKTERTAEEEKKLSAVTLELAKQYPGAITAVGNFGAEVELAADKLNQLYQAEKQARMENTRHELEKTEQKITETEEKIARLQAQLQDGTKTVAAGSSITGYNQTITVQMSDEDKGKILKQIDELRYGEDGQSGLLGLQQSADAARRALGLLPSEAAQSVEKFGAWKKTLTTFRKQVGDIRVQLFDDSTIAQFGSLEEALKKTAEQYKTNIALVKVYDNVLKSTIITAEERAKIETERAEADAMATLAKKALDYYNTSPTAFDKSKKSRGSKSDDRLSKLQEIESTLTKINQKYDELVKKEGQTKALEDINKLYGDTLKYVNKLGKQFKLNFSMPTELKTLQDYRKAIQGVIEKLKMKGYEKAALDLEEKIGTGDIDALQKQLEIQLKELADRISRTKTAKEFYDKILSTTGDYSLASKVADSIFGQNGAGLQKALADQVRGMTNGIELPDGIISADNIINYKALREFAEANKTELGKMYDELIKISNDGQKDLAKTYEGYLKDLEKAKTYADKRVELARTTAEKIADIEAGIKAGNTDENVGKETIRGLQEAEERKAAQLEYDAFKDTPLYVQMFEDLEHASTSTLEMMKSRLEALKGVWGTALDPMQLKEIQSRMNEIDGQLRERNPFKTLKESYQQYRDAVKSVSLQGAGENAGAAAKDYYDKSVAYGGDSAQARAAEKELKAREKIVEIARQINAENKKGQEALDAAAQIANDNLKIKRGELDIALAEEIALRKKSTYENKDEDPAVIAAHEKVEAAKEEVNLAERVAEITTDNAKTAKTLKENFASAANQVTKYMGMAGDLAHAVADTMEALGGDENDVQFWNDIGTAIEDLTAGLQGLIDSVLSLNAAGAISSAIGVIPNMVKGFVGLFTAGKVRKANKGIKRQQELLEQLEYTYGRLEKSADKVFGRDYLNNYNQQLKILQAQQQAYQKQAEAERSKGKKADKDKIKDFENQARETADKIKELQDDRVAHFTGSSKTDVARQMAKSWIDARASMSDTFAAIKGDYQEMIKNMIVEGAAARVIENALSPMWDSMEKMLADNDVDGAIDSLINGMDSALNAANNGMEVLWQALEARGYDMKKLISDTDSEYSGIAKSVAGATSEEINNVAAIGNTLMYYVSPIPRMDANLARVVALMEGGGSSVGSTASAGWTDWQQQAMDNYIAIQRNTADTVVECRRAANACEDAVEKLSRVISPKGVQAQYGVNVFLR